MEKFCIINGFDNYAISNYGRIKNIKNGRILKPCVNHNGYYSYVFCQNGIKKGFRIHRLVAIYHVPNPNNLPYVNHIDGDKLNNNANNLEWCTAKYNDTHARENNLKKQNKPILATNIETNEKNVFYSIGEASGIIGVNKGNIYRVLNHIKGCKQTRGYTFQYI